MIFTGHMFTFSIRSIKLSHPESKGCHLPNHHALVHKMGLLFFVSRPVFVLELKILNQCKKGGCEYVNIMTQLYGCDPYISISRIYIFFKVICRSCYCYYYFFFNPLFP